MNIPLRLLARGYCSFFFFFLNHTSFPVNFKLSRRKVSSLSNLNRKNCSQLSSSARRVWTHVFNRVSTGGRRWPSLTGCSTCKITKTLQTKVSANIWLGCCVLFHLSCLKHLVSICFFYFFRLTLSKLFIDIITHQCNNHILLQNKGKIQT